MSFRALILTTLFNNAHLFSFAIVALEKSLKAYLRVKLNSSRIRIPDLSAFYEEFRQICDTTITDNEFYFEVIRLSKFAQSIRYPVLELKGKGKGIRKGAGYRLFYKDYHGTDCISLYTRNASVLTQALQTIQNVTYTNYLDAVKVHPLSPTDFKTLSRAYTNPSLSNMSRNILNI